MDKFPLSDFWDAILSRNPRLIQNAFALLDESSKKAVVNHLQKMITESGWHPEQVKSAKAALTVIQGIGTKTRRIS